MTENCIFFTNNIHQFCFSLFCMYLSYRLSDRKKKTFKTKYTDCSYILRTVFIFLIFYFLEIIFLIVVVSFDIKVT